MRSVCVQDVQHAAQTRLLLSYFKHLFTVAHAYSSLDTCTGQANGEYARPFLHNMDCESTWDEQSYFFHLPALFVQKQMRSETSICQPYPLPNGKVPLHRECADYGNRRVGCEFDQEGSENKSVLDRFPRDHTVIGRRTRRTRTGTRSRRRRVAPSGGLERGCFRIVV